MKTKLILSIILALGVVINLTAQSYPPNGWRVSVPIVEASGAQKFSEVVVKGDNVYTIWIDNREGYYRVYFKKSTDCGFTWSTEIPISLPDETVADGKRNISITGIDNYLYVVYTTVDVMGYAVRFCLSSDDGATWEGHQPLIENLVTAPEPSIAVSSDSLHVVFCKDPYIAYKAKHRFDVIWQPHEIIECGCWPDRCPDITIVNNVPHVTFVSNPAPVFCAIFHAKPSVSPPGWTVTLIFMEVMPSIPLTYYYPHIAEYFDGNQSLLYVKWERDTLIAGPATGHIKFGHSTDDGASWEISAVGEVDQAAGSDFVAGSNGLTLVFGSTVNYDILGSISTDHGMTWSTPFKLANATAGTYAPLPKLHCCIGRGYIARHLIFQRGLGTTENLDYMANDDLLLSNTEYATAYNGGRHLVRDPFTSFLHLVYFSQGRPHYTWSIDNGATWAPYHIMENIHTTPVTKDSGYYPSVGLVPAFIGCQPCVVYLDNENRVEYRYYDDFAGEWRGFTICEQPPNGQNDPPSVAAIGSGIVYVLVPVHNNPPTLSEIKFYEFYFNATEPGEGKQLDNSLNGLGEPCITLDGDYNLHCVWRKYDDIRYARREGTEWHLDDPFFPTLPPEWTCSYPFIECNGIQLAVPFVVTNMNTPAIYWNTRNLLPPGDWVYPLHYRVSRCEPCFAHYPTSASWEFTVWSEQREVGGTNYDIKWFGHTHGNEYWVWESPLNSYYAHSQVYWDWSIYRWRLYTAWTEGDECPYIIQTVERIIENQPGGDAPAYYRIETGNPSPSFFCTKRDGFINYPNTNVDYGTSDLEYTLTLLNPIYPAYKVKFFTYFQGTAPRTEQVFVDGTPYATFTYPPNILKISEFLIPQEFYRNDHKAVLSFHSANGVTKAGFVIYQLERIGEGGGPQSSNDLSLNRSLKLTVSPNPVYNTATISYCLSDNTEISLSLFDAAGRLIRNLDAGNKTKGLHRVKITTENLAQGIYFLKLESSHETSVDKLVVIR